MTKENEQLYYEASQNGKWIRYNGKWYMPGEFGKELGNRTLDKSLLRIEDPRVIVNEGMSIVINMVRNGQDKKAIEEALKKLHKFTATVIDNYTPVHRLFPK